MSLKEFLSRNNVIPRDLSCYCMPCLVPPTSYRLAPTPVYMWLDDQHESSQVKMSRKSPIAFPFQLASATYGDSLSQAQAAQRANLISPSPPSSPASFQFIGLAQLAIAGSWSKLGSANKGIVMEKYSPKGRPLNPTLRAPGVT